MRKFLMLLMMLGLICFNAVGFAAAAEIGDAGAVQRPFSERLKIAAAKAGESDGLSKVAVLYVNNANTTYDADIDRAVLENVQAALKTSACEYIDGTEFLGQFNETALLILLRPKELILQMCLKAAALTTLCWCRWNLSSARKK